MRSSVCTFHASSARGERRLGEAVGGAVVLGGCRVLLQLGIELRPARLRRGEDLQPFVYGPAYNSMRSGLQPYPTEAAAE